MPAYSIRPYSPSDLGALFDKYSHKGEGRSQEKSHLGYFDEYFMAVGAKTIFIEENYTDKDYTEDFAAYYARCHEPYQKLCARLHFFDFEFDEKFISSCIDRSSADIARLKTGYLGFIVVKPLPSTIIGRTCLKTYGNKGRERRFPTAHEHKAHLLGIELSVSSVPFQEQDTDVAACATSALWSAFYCTGKLFNHHIPTPAEITEAAAAHQRPFGRPLPAASGLSYGQMADALRSEGLEPLLLNANDPDFVRIAAHAYLRSRIPSLLLGQIGSGWPKFEGYGGHAIAILGYSVSVKAPRPWAPTGCLFRATAIERLYVHDDQVGPFARLRFENDKPIGTSWKDRTTKTIGNVFFLPEMLIIPLYHKIRVPVDLVANRDSRDR